MKYARFVRLAACLGAGLLYQRFVLRNFLPLEIKVEDNDANISPEQALEIGRQTCSKSKSKLPYVGQGGSFIWTDGVILCHENARVDCLTKLGRNMIFWFSDQIDPHTLWWSLDRKNDQFYMIVEREFGQPDGAPYFEDIWNYARELEWSVLALQKWDRLERSENDDVSCAEDWAFMNNRTCPSPISIWRAQNNPLDMMKTSMIRLLRPSIFTKNSSAKDRDELVRFHQLYTSVDRRNGRP